MTKDDPVRLYLPRPDTSAAHTIDRGSGIVGTPANEWNQSAYDESDLLVIDFEGSRYNRVNVVTFYDRVAHAHGRHYTRYPTIARMTVPADDLMYIGDFHPAIKWLDVHVQHVVGLIAWLTDEDGHGPNLHVEVRPGSAVFA